jgi:S1-C subfamily serine protease
MSNLLQQLNDDLTASVEHARRSLVEIRNGHGGAGAGIIIRANGLIITNAHVIGRRGLKVTLPDGRPFDSAQGKTLPAQLIAHDREHDLAALSVDATDLPTIALGDSRQLQPGQWVMAIGHPWGMPGAVTGGIVIGSGSEFPEMPPSGRDWVVVSLHMRPGHSGGPLIDSEDRLVGVNTMITGPDVGVAVPAHVVKAFLKEMGEIQPTRQPQHAASVMV